MRYIIGRLLYSVLVLVCVSVVVFGALRIAPGDVTTQIMDPTTTQPETIQALRDKLGLDRPIWVQYADYMSGLLRGDLGASLITGESVLALLLRTGFYTLVLASSAFLVMMVGGIVLGAIAAFRHGTVVDRLIMGVAGLLVAVPNYVFAVVLIMVFGLQLGWLPVSGSESWQHLIMPAIVLAGMPLGLAIRLVRSSVLEQIHVEYVSTLRARGVKERRIKWVHQIRGALTPVISMAANEIRSLLGYTLIVEVVFRWPGIGSMHSGRFKV